MALNGTELLENPFDVIFSPFEALLGTGWILIPITIIGFALYVKQRSLTGIGVYFIASGVFMSTATLFAGYPAMVDVYFIMAALGLVSVLIDIFFLRR